MTSTPTFNLLLMQQNDTNNVDNLNTNLERLDAFSNLVIEEEVDAPPASPNYGRVWLVSAAPAGEFAGNANKLAAWVSNGDDADGWVFQDPFEGMTGYFLDTGELKTYNGSAWVAPSGSRTASTTWPFTRVESTQGSTSGFRVACFYAENQVTVSSARFVYTGNTGSVTPQPVIRYDSSAAGSPTGGTLLIDTGDWSGSGTTTTGETWTGSLTVPAGNFVYFYLNNGQVVSNVDAEGLLVFLEYAE